MDRGAVLAKTGKGIEEIKSRAHGLPVKVRALLIMADGRKTVDELVEKLGGTAEIEIGLQSLIDQGYVEMAVSPAPKAKEAADSPRDNSLDNIDLGGG